jgi:hypothetical protein
LLSAGLLISIACNVEIESMIDLVSNPKSLQILLSRISFLHWPDGKTNHAKFAGYRWPRSALTNQP